MIEAEAEDEAWSRVLPDWEALCVRAAAAALQSSPVGGGGPAKLVKGALATSARQSGRSPSTAFRDPPPPAGRDLALSILLTDDATVRDLNHRFRGKDAATNVLSFPAHETAAGQLGDIALAYGVCAREADDQGKPLSAHLQHLVAHGVLHLLGYDHEDDAEAEVMEDLERQILARLGLPDPYA